MIENDPNRCSRCHVYVRGDVADETLRTSFVDGRKVCRNRTACDARIRVVESLDRLLGKIAA